MSICSLPKVALLAIAYFSTDPKSRIGLTRIESPQRVTRNECTPRVVLNECLFFSTCIQTSRQSSSQQTQLSRAPEHHFDKAAIVPSVTI